MTQQNNCHLQEHDCHAGEEDGCSAYKDIKKAETADQEADLYRKYEDVYSPSYTTPAAYRYRIRKIIKEKIEPWGTYKAKVKIDPDKKDEIKDMLLKLLEKRRIDHAR